MLKIAPLALGLLTVLSIVPNAQAYPLQQPTSQPQLSIIIGGQQPIYQGQPGYHGHSKYNYRVAELRRLELERERQRELAAERRRRQYHSRHNTGYYSNGHYNTGVYNAGVYRAPVNDRDGYNNRGGYENNANNGGYNNQDHHNR
jgi:hypothetical protein